MDITTLRPVEGSNRLSEGALMSTQYSAASGTDQSGHSPRLARTSSTQVNGLEAVIEQGNEGAGQSIDAAATRIVQEKTPPGGSVRKPVSTSPRALRLNASVSCVTGSSAMKPAPAGA